MKATKKKPIEHQDQIGQAIKPGQAVAFAYSYTAGVRIGTVEKLTPKRVKIRYKYDYMGYDGVRRSGEWTHQAHPDRTVVLSESLQPELTMLRLKGLLP